VLVSVLVLGLGKASGDVVLAFPFLVVGALAEASAFALKAFHAPFNP